MLVRYCITLLLGITCLTGCGASLDITRDKQGNITKINAKGAQESEVKKGDESVKIKTQQKWWPELPSIIAR